MTRMGEVICFDTTPPIWGVREDCDRGDEHCIAKTKKYIDYLKRINAKILVPAPVLAEYLIGAVDTELNELSVLRRNFQIGNLDVASAVTAAKLQRKGKLKAIEEDYNLDRQCIKADALIIAIAIHNHSSKIITRDDHFKVLADGRIPISPVPDIDIAEQQGLGF